MENKNLKKYNCVNPFNYIRSLAVLCVFLLHVSLFSGQLGFVYTERTWILKTPAWSAVWILFLLSGYFIGKGFYREGGYEFSPRGFLKFYLRRLLKVGIPTWIFIFISCTIVEPQFIVENPTVIFRILTFTYYNIPSSNCIGATWYVSTLMWLYMLAPFVCLLVDAVTRRMKKYVTQAALLSIIVLGVLGFCYRVYMFRTGADWSSQVYVPFYANLDLYISGILLNYLKIPKVESDRKKLLFGSLIKVAFVIGIIINCYIAYRADYSMTYLFIYQYVLPSFYLVGVCIYIFVAEMCYLPQERLNCGNVMRNPFRLLDLFARISFEFYLVHSMVISQIFVYFSGSNLLLVHLKVVGVSFVLSVCLAYLMKKMFDFVREKERGKYHVV